MRKLRFSMRQALVLLTLAVVVFGLWSQRGRWLAWSLQRNSDKVPAWKALLAHNDLEASHLRAKPRKVWWDDSPGTGAPIWVLAGDTLTAVSSAGKILDHGGIMCRGKPRALWTGTTPDGQHGIVMISDAKHAERKHYLMFVSTTSHSYVRLLVQINIRDYRSKFSLDDGWPCVELCNGDSTYRERFTTKPTARSAKQSKGTGQAYWNVALAQ